MDRAGEGPGAGGGDAEPLSWPEFYGLVETETGWKPSEVDALDGDDVGDLVAWWRRRPGAPAARSGFPAPEPGRRSLDIQKPATPEAMKRLAEQLNRQMTGRG